LGFSKKLKISFKVASLLAPSPRPRKELLSKGRLLYHGADSMSVVPLAGRLVFSLICFAGPRAACWLDARTSGDLLQQLDVEAERLKLFDEHVEALGETWI
jgi:hypothetical protein